MDGGEGGIKNNDNLFVLRLYINPDEGGVCVYALELFALLPYHVNQHLCRVGVLLRQAPSSKGAL